MKRSAVLLPLVLAFAACSSPPKPPTVDESTKRPANTRTAIELQVCKGELDSSRLTIREAERAAEATFGHASRLVAAANAARDAAQRAKEAAPVAPPRNILHTVRFEFASTQLVMSERDTARLVADTRDAAMIVLRGRTDAATETLADARIARQRAASVRDFLVKANVDPSRIRTTWQAAGDHVTENSSPEGRAANRRVEIEIYRSPPQQASADVAPRL